MNSNRAVQIKPKILVYGANFFNLKGLVRRPGVFLAVVGPDFPLC